MRRAAQALVIELHGRRVPYALRRSARRTLGLRIDREGVRVAAPHAAPRSAVEAFLRDNGRWVIDKLDAWAQHPAAPRIALVDGARFPLFDGDCRLRVVAGRPGRWRLLAGEAESCLEVSCRAGQSVARAALSALDGHGLERLGARVVHFAARLGVAPPPVRLSSARTRWGSCSARSIHLNRRLVHLPGDVVDYVVAHEVAHLAHMNHSPAFWAQVRALYPAADAARARLHTLGQQVPELFDPAT